MRREHEARIAEILDRIRDIPPGHVQTYGDIDPEAPRLVGRVLATTRESGLPWFRVVRSDGSVAEGEHQLQLLRKDGVPMRGGRVDLERARA
jgi:methylated-DNA-protein-cysteine methyltransferase related protein